MRQNQSKIIPVYKKGTKANIENYRPVANLCSASLIFERLFLNRILQLESFANIDLIGKQQHGFKKGKGTATACLTLQSKHEHELAITVTTMM